MLATMLSAFAVPASAGAVLYGDANKDGNVNMKDVLMVRKYVAGIEVDIDLVAADVNGDGVVNMKDVLTERKFVANIIDVMPADKEPAYDPDTTWLLAKKIRYSGYGVPTVALENTYDENGNLILSQTSSDRFEYTYDENGNQLSVVCYTKYDTLSYRREYTYDENKNPVSSRMLNESGVVNWKSVDTWDATYEPDGRLLTELHRNADDTINYWIEYSYDEKGHQIRSEYRNADGSVDMGSTDTWSKTYDINGNMITQRFYDKGGAERYVKEYTYDNNGNQTGEYDCRADGSVILYFEFTYDNDGRMLTSRQYNGTTGNLEWKSDMTFDKAYDAYGNLIKETYYETAVREDRYFEYEYIAFKPAQ